MASLGPSTLIAGRYRTVRLIGRGGSGTVYEVEHVHTGQRLAMKVLNIGPDADLARFSREARAMSRLQNENVVRITDADFASELDNSPFLVMDLLEGGDLEKACEAGPVPLLRAVDWLGQVARGLDAVHSAGIVHRDLKPQNLFLAHVAEGRDLVKILDFGISKMAVEGESITITNQFLGTPYYMAPEQADSAGTPITHRADLFALGLVAFRLLVGHLYWKPGTLSHLLRQVLLEPIDPPSVRGARFGKAFDAWFMRACHRDVNRRFGTAREQVEALEAALNSAPLEFVETLAKTTPSSGFLVPSPSHPRKLPTRARHGVGILFALLGIVCVGALALNFQTQRAGGDAGDSPSAPLPQSTASIGDSLELDAARVPSAVAQPTIYGESGGDVQARPDPNSRGDGHPKGSRRLDAASPPYSRPGSTATARDPLEGQF